VEEGGKYWNENSLINLDSTISQNHRRLDGGGRGGSGGAGEYGKMRFFVRGMIRTFKVLPLLGSGSKGKITEKLNKGYQGPGERS